MVKSRDILPTSKEIGPHLLQLLYFQKKMNRSCTTHMAYDYIVEKLGLSAEARGYVYPCGRKKWDYNIQSVKKDLKDKGFVKDEPIEGMKNRSLWSITSSGESYYEQNF